MAGFYQTFYNRRFYATISMSFVNRDWARLRLV